MFTVPSLGLARLLPPNARGSQRAWWGSGVRAPPWCFDPGPSPPVPWSRGPVVPGPLVSLVPGPWQPVLLLCFFGVLVPAPLVPGPLILGPGPSSPWSPDPVVSSSRCRSFVHALSHDKKPVKQRNIMGKNDIIYG